MSEKRRTYNINFNKGLDKSSLPFEASPARALDELNYVYRDGKVQKRFGYKNIHNVTANAATDQYIAMGGSTPIYNTTGFNGLWRFKAEDGEYHIVAHIGKLLYELFQMSGEWYRSILYETRVFYAGSYYPKCTEFEDAKSTAVIGNNCLWFFGGTKYMRLRFMISGNSTVHSLTAVDSDENTYIPTTTISITEEGSAIAGRQSLDEVNLLSEMRINKLTGGTFEEGSDGAKSLRHTFELDAPIVSADEEPLSKISVDIDVPPNIGTALSPYSALPAEGSGIIYYTGDATHVMIDLVVLDKDGMYRDSKASINYGEPTRAATLFSDAKLVKIKLTFYKLEPSSTFPYGEDGPEVISDITIVKQFWIDLDEFISLALNLNSGFEVSWSSGASLIAYNETDVSDRLTIHWSQSSFEATLVLDANVIKTSAQSSISLKAVALPREMSITITSNLGDAGAYFESVNAILIPETVESDWVDELVGTSLSLESSNNGTSVIASGTTNLVYGIVSNYGDTTKNGLITLFGDWRSDNRESNIDVKFPCYVAGNADKINKCHIAKLFGNANAKNRLFVSGNADLPNCDWHSSAYGDYEAETDSNGDFSYFGDMDYCFYGQTDNAIMGYDNVATDKMVVLKSKSKVEPTNYFRTSSLIQAIDASGNALSGIDGSALYQESFPLATGNIGAGAMNYKSVVNLNGDTLYISSENSICGLNIAGQVGDSQRISYSRSRYIDPELKELDLSDAVLWTDNNSLYLFADDVSYMTHYETFDSETSQYEWFKIDIKNVTCALDIDGVMFFGTKDGGLYCFEKDSYTDKDIIMLAAGGALYANDKITYTSSLNSKLSVDSHYKFKCIASTLSNRMFRKVATIADAEIMGCDLWIEDEDTTVLKIIALDGSLNYDAERHMVLVEELAAGATFYLNHSDSDPWIDCAYGSVFDGAFYTPFKLVPIDGAEDEYHMLNANGEIMDLATLYKADICVPLDEEYDVTDLDKMYHTFKLRRNGRVIDVVQYSNQNMSVTGGFQSVLTEYNPVKAYFIAAPTALGALGYRKTIWSWTLTAFREPNDLQVCQATNEEQMDDMRGIAFSDVTPIGFNFGLLSFAQVDFEKSIVPRKYTYIRPLSVPFLSFGFKSEKDANSILTTVSIVYTVPMLGRGDR